MDPTATPAPAKAKNPFRISLRRFCADMMIMDEESLLEYAESLAVESTAPALCIEGCEVEPDGRCPHGCPSVLIALGVM